MKASLSSASSLVGLQLFSRGFTFVLNQALLRLASPQAFGTAAIQFEFILSTILFLSREGVRNTLLRTWPSPDRPSNINTAITSSNLATVPIFIGFPIAVATASLYSHLASKDTHNQPHFQLALVTYALAAIIELCSEPMHNRTIGEHRTGIRVRAEGLGIAVKSVITYFILLYDSKQGLSTGRYALQAFALGQLAYSLLVFATYTTYLGFPSFWLGRRNQSAIDPKAGAWHTLVSTYFDAETLRLSMNMTYQSIVKHFLTEGDKLIVSWWSPLQDQGGYAVAVNYGSLVARIIFQPVEETCRVFFSKTLSSTKTSLDGSSSKPQSELDSTAIRQASTALITLLSVQLVFSLLVVVFGSLYLPIFLHIFLPQRYLSTSAPHVLQVWVWYIPFLAINGGLEAFFSSVANPEDLSRQSRWMVAFSIIYIVSAMTFYNLHLGDTSLVYANIINLVARICYTSQFISAYLKRHRGARELTWWTAMPRWQFILMSMISLSAIVYNARRAGVEEIVALNGQRALLNPTVVLHVSLGIGLGILCLVTWWATTGKHLFSATRSKTA
ncbi:Rft protein-domain-containing protein [Hygrophoropsis aurantiaca]|uniref:Rft protein-domain-containing protein n=1 Tax=Hygrophoropsis aurantiaca TaxID=72124 RepID=A0ACB7ZXP1_9AGAM|nr:Rft protein-domain-containing protein [Hygrophoropsis aurantiaca]